MRSFFFADEVAITFWSQSMAVLVTAFLALPVIHLLRKMRRTFHFSNK